MFVDGENLAIRWKNQSIDKAFLKHVVHKEDVYVWSTLLNMPRHLHCNIIRKHYYTSAKGDELARNNIHDEIKALDIESPYVFPKTKERGSKQVDITLAVDMLSHAYQNNYEVAVLVAGDEDYVPLVNAVKNAGRRVFLWFLEDGLSPVLKRSADYFFDIGSVLCKPDAPKYFQ